MNAKSRGYFKIKDAASAFNFDFRGKTVLDIGSSTGGFTQYALDHGATKVIAVEKGTNQMAKPLRYDPRVELHEKTDILDFIPGTQEEPFEGISERGSARVSAGRPWLSYGRTRPEKVLSCVPDIILADVSFISLTIILAYAKTNLSDTHTDFLVMLKPQFEATPDQLNRGVIKNEKIRREIIKNFEQWLKQNNFIIINKRDNSLKGKTGNQEKFYWLKQGN
ncbi:hypothetical protein IJH01_03285 [Candidatus Saccharibacteria bacterium]|nr:hypothetical protein [Candidatus Saccharibacteria bacterium]